MHGDSEVVDLELSPLTGEILSNGEIVNIEHIPPGVNVTTPEDLRDTLSMWWTCRVMPSNRIGLTDALKRLSICNVKILALESLGTNLSDHYWIRPIDDSRNWSDVNHFTNRFSGYVGDVLFGLETSNDKDTHSPDCSTDGVLRKRWVRSDGDIVLYKGGSLPYRQQPVNECIASMIAERLRIPHTEYTSTSIGDRPYSVCRCFTDVDTELITALGVMLSSPRLRGRSMYRHFVQSCIENGLEDPEHMLDMMIVLNHIICNEDRHFKNFGILRDPVTLVWKGIAPIFDSGSSLYYNKPLESIEADDITQCKPFKVTHEIQMHLITSFDWIDFGNLDNIGEDVREMLLEDGQDPKRSTAIAVNVDRRVDELRLLSENPVFYDYEKDDLTKVIASTYRSD